MDYILTWLLNNEVPKEWAEPLSIIIKIIFIALLCIVANFITKKVIIRVISYYVSKSKATWDNILFERKVFRKLSHIVPALIIYHYAQTFPAYQDFIEKLSVTYFIIVGIIVINSLLEAVNDIYKTYEISKVRPIKGYLQVLYIIIVIIGIILIIANFLDKSPLILLSGIGALSAVLLLVFKDSLLGLVAGIQLSANDMVRVGDWIEMPKYGADGDIIDITLNTVKVQNFDKTITMIPSYALISDSFKNWRGMQTSGGRRIKRAINIDTSSIMFCTVEMIDKFRNIHYLEEYIDQKLKEINEYNEKNQIDKSVKVNGRGLTNIGTFRAYVINYLKNHPGINQDMTLIVRQLAPSETGLPLEIYAFTNDTKWDYYESVQADIFDHLFAVAPEFGLRVFQNPSGHDLKGAYSSTTSSSVQQES